jgi:L-ribulose-5-phosphate 4-epimerase
MLETLREKVLTANVALVASGLVRLTWGNVSGIDRERGMVAIKPSGVPYADLRAEDLVIVALADGAIVEGKLRPSSDTPTHLALYRTWPTIGGICHSHSLHATMFAQAGRPLPCFGTTHADHFHGPIPLCRALTPQEVAEDYEGNTGAAILEHFAEEKIDPVTMPAVLQAYHAPFTWGPTPAAAVENSIALETCAEMALGSLTLHPMLTPLPAHLLDKHHRRKHGPDAYYGQRGNG